MAGGQRARRRCSGRLRAHRRSARRRRSRRGGQLAL